MTRYLELEEVLLLHAVLLKKYNGATGIRDQGSLMAALYRPQSGYYADIIQEAAALWESLSQNHPFVDGNKRVAFAAVDTFLRLNGYVIKVADLAAYNFMMNLYETGTFEFSALDAWLREHAKPVTT